MNASRSSRSDRRQSLSTGWIGMVKKPRFMEFSTVIPERREAPCPESITTILSPRKQSWLWIPALAALGRNDIRETFTSCNVAPCAVALRRVEHRFERGDGVQDARIIDLERPRSERCSGKRIQIGSNVI